MTFLFVVCYTNVLTYLLIYLLVTMGVARISLGGVRPKCEYTRGESESSFLTAHQHKIGYLVPL